MFIANKYNTWYFSIITKAKEERRRRRKRTDPLYQRYEQHHIVPRSIGGSDDPENLVLLTTKEHFICHLLLPMMCSESKHRGKMIYALTMMANYAGKCSRYYIRVRAQAALLTSNALKGIPKSPEHIKKMVNSRKGFKHSEETKREFRKQRAGTNSRTPEQSRKAGDSLRGREFSESHRQNLSKALKGRVPWNKGLKGANSRGASAD